MNGIFVDLGSGTGKAVFVASMLHEFEQVKGIEVLEALCNQSKEILHKYKNRVVKKVNVDRQDNAIEFVRDDFVMADWSAATSIFSLCTCFTEELRLEMQERADRCQKGTWFITVTHPLGSEHYRLVECRKYKFSFGEATVFTQRKA